MPGDVPPRAGLLQGTLDLLIVRTLLAGPAHGHAIAKHIQRTSEDLLQVETGSLYPALQRLMRQGAISAEWGVSGTERRVRMYRLTAKGRTRLAAERTRWEQLSEAIAGLMQPPATEEP